MHIQDAGLPTRLTNVLRGEGVHTIEQLSTMSEGELGRTPGISFKSIKQIRYALHRTGLRSEPLETVQITLRPHVREKLRQLCGGRSASEVLAELIEQQP